MSTTTVACLFLLLATLTALASTLPVQRRETDKDVKLVGDKGTDCLSSNCEPPPGKRRRKSVDETERLILKTIEQQSKKRDEAGKLCLGSRCNAPFGKRDIVRKRCLGWDCWQEDHDQGKRDADSAADVTAKRAQPCDYGECDGPRNGKRIFETILRSLGTDETDWPPQPRKRVKQSRRRSQEQGKRGHQQRKRGNGGCPPWECRDPSEVDDKENGNGSHVSQ